MSPSTLMERMQPVDMASIRAHPPMEEDATQTEIENEDESSISQQNTPTEETSWQRK